MGQPNPQIFLSENWFDNTSAMEIVKYKDKNRQTHRLTDNEIDRLTHRKRRQKRENIDRQSFWKTERQGDRTHPPPTNRFWDNKKDRHITREKKTNRKNLNKDRQTSHMKIGLTKIKDRQIDTIPDWQTYTKTDKYVSWHK